MGHLTTESIKMSRSYLLPTFEEFKLAFAKCNAVLESVSSSSNKVSQQVNLYHFIKDYHHFCNSFVISNLAEAESVSSSSNEVSQQVNDAAT
jgi:hypothetical protein